MAKPFEIVIESDALGAVELRNALGRTLPAGCAIGLEFRDRESPFRLEPVMLVAIISGGFQVLAALVSGLLAVGKREGKRDLPAHQAIRIEDAAGVVVEIPIDLPTAKGLDLLKAARGRKLRRIYLVSPP